MSALVYALPEPVTRMKSSARMRFMADASLIFTAAWYSVSKAATVFLSSSMDEFDPADREDARLGCQQTAHINKNRTDRRGRSPVLSFALEYVLCVTIPTVVSSIILQSG